MATRKRSASKTSQQQQPPPRACIACTELESEVQLIQPCRTCAMDYCTGCLASMFEDAVTDSTRMPPRCCNLIQIHTILGSGLLSDEQAKAYREKFEEWITPAKVRLSLWDGYVVPRCRDTYYAHAWASKIRSFGDRALFLQDIC